jgi:hypothetical protein
MFLYGHMLRVQDKMLYTSKDGDPTMMAVRDLWPSKYYPGGRWAELWIEGGDLVPRHAAVVYISDFKPLFDVQRPSGIQVGTPKQTYAPADVGERWVDGFGRPTSPPEYVGGYQRG